MAWTSPRTWSTSELVTAAHLNEQIRDNMTEVVRRYAGVTTTNDVTSSSAETTLFTQAITGGHMSTHRMLRLTMLGDVLYNNSTADTLTWRVKFGGTTHWADVSSGVALSATRQPWVWTVYVANLGAANSQMVSTHILSGNNAAGTSASTGLGFIATLDAASANTNLVPSGGVGGIGTLAAIDTASDQTLAASVQWSAAHANDSWRLRYAALELV